MEDYPSNENGEKGGREHGQGRFEDREGDRRGCGQTMGRQTMGRQSQGRQAHPLLYVVRAEASLSLHRAKRRL